MPASRTPLLEPSGRSWTRDRVVTFALTLAATRSVTRAARSTGLSRKSAYARRAADPGFAALWDRALDIAHMVRLDMLRARRRPSRQGDEAHEAHDPPNSSIRGDTSELRRRAADSAREAFFAGLESRLLSDLAGPRLGRPLANFRKQADGGGLEERA